MALDDVHKVLSKHVVDIKIDIDRTIGGKDVLAKYQGERPGGIPWFAFLKPDGTVIANGIVDGKNLGCPWNADEKAKFAVLLEHAAGVETADIERILARLGEGAS
jgi:hypothetical protein